MKYKLGPDLKHYDSKTESLKLPSMPVIGLLADPIRTLLPVLLWVIESYISQAPCAQIHFVYRE